MAVRMHHYRYGLGPLPLSYAKAQEVLSLLLLHYQYVNTMQKANTTNIVIK